ncbi:MAG: FAD-dependent oxidoreductase [Dehalococcoidia bacterium]
MREMDELAAGPALDAAIVGGGINGAAIARELAARGQRVALFEQDDFGSGTTWRSTKLIHGGLRYLEHGDVRLVFESLRERKWLLKTRPHLVRPLRFLLPDLPWTRRPAWQVGIGLTAYDAIALGGGLPRHRRVNASRAADLSPAIRENNGGFTFFDARVLSPERLVLELVLEARRLGAAVFNHACVAEIVAGDGRVEAITVEAGGTAWRVPVTRVINAAGPWVDAVARLARPKAQDILGVTRGTHLVFEPEEMPTRSAVLSTARSDGRVFFAIPKGKLLLVGTTDERYDGDPGAVAPTRHEADYLLAEAQELFPRAGLGNDRFRYAYAGLRPLVRAAGGPAAAISRRHEVIDHGRRGGPDGLFSVVGGKLSTFRPLAREMADALGTNRPSRGDENGFSGTATDFPNEPGKALRIYGDAAGDVAALGREFVCEHAWVTTGQVRYATRHEMARSLADIVLRRTGMGWSATRGLCCVESVADVAAAELGWGQDERTAQLEELRSEVRRHLPAFEEIPP